MKPNTCVPSAPPEDQQWPVRRTSQHSRARVTGGQECFSVSPSGDSAPEHGTAGNSDTVFKSFIFVRWQQVTKAQEVSHSKPLGLNCMSCSGE